MPTDPFVAPDLEDAPRQEPNLAPGVRLPAARGWKPTRPGDLAVGQPHGARLGSPGPNVGYALTLAQRVRDRIALAPHESADDALAVISELAMKRAASFGRAPVMNDVEVACSILGYKGEPDPDFVRWRAAATHGASHEYEVRRSLVDAVPERVARTPPQVLELLADLWNRLMKADGAPAVERR